MKGDFTRDTFDAAKHFSRVLMQQGRVQLDADWNEQEAILLHYIQTLAADIIGPHGGPAGRSGFEISIANDNKNFTIGKGHYYVDGILCENDAECAYTDQDDYPLDLDPNSSAFKDNGDYVVFLDAWEHLITHLDEGHIREVALGGPDTAARAKVVWQVKLKAVTAPEKNCKDVIDNLRKSGDLSSRGKMEAKLKRENTSPDPCITAPESKYRGAENQLYRVEIHQVTMNADGKTPNFSFKWSRENGSIVAAWLDTNDDGGLVVSTTRGFEAGSWVEITNWSDEMHNIPGEMIKIEKVEGGALYLEPGLKADSEPNSVQKIRQWDQRKIGDVKLEKGAVIGEISDPTKDPVWFDLEKGIQVHFTGGGLQNGDWFRSGDYWLIPARVATGEIEWPDELDANDKTLEHRHEHRPRGVQHHLAPLAMIHWEDNKLSLVPPDCRDFFDELTKEPVQNG